MSLGIFSFDLATLINSLANYLETVETENPPFTATLENIESVLQSAADSEPLTAEGVIIAAALESSVTPVIAAAEKLPKAPPVQNPPPAVRSAPPKLNDETRREIERLIKSLQTSVIHNYKSTDMIDETAARELISKFGERKIREDSPDEKESARQQKKMDERRLETLRAELKKTILNNNLKVKPA